ncbi:hypothetical protein [Streptomyces sp. NPDC054787]
MKTSTSRTYGARALRLVAVAPRCHLCPDEHQVLADPTDEALFDWQGTGRES